MGSQTVSLYQSINELPLSNFITCLVDNNLNALVKSGLPTSEVLQDTWYKIHEEYSDCIGDTETKVYLSLFKEVNQLAAKIELTTKILSVLQNYRIKQFEDELQAILKTNFVFDASNPVEYDALLMRCYNRSKSFLISFDLKNTHLQEMQKKFDGKGEKPSREYFSNTLNMLSMFNKYRICATDITTYEYIDLIKIMNKSNVV